MSKADPTAGPRAGKPAASSASRRPGPGRPTREQAERRNEELLDRALDLFYELGYERATMEGIAASVGMAKRTVYARYNDKLALFKASLERAISHWIIPVDELRAQESDDLEESLRRIGRMLVHNMMRPEGLRLLRISNAEASRLPAISAYTYERGTGPTLEYLEELLGRRLPSRCGSQSQRAEAALSFLYLVVGGPASLSAWGVPMDDARIDSHTDYCVNLFLYGLLSDKMAQ